MAIFDQIISLNRQMLGAAKLGVNFSERFVFPDLYIAVSTPEKDLDQGLAAYNNGDYETAIAKWKPLAEAGEPSAQYYLGLVYFNGQGVLQDYLETIQWFKLAVEQGKFEAQYNIAFTYANGRGVRRDNLTAYMWLYIAGYSENKLAARVGEFRDELAKRMTNAEISQGTLWAKECLNSGYTMCGY